MSSSFVYVTYIRATPDKVWEALTKPEFVKQYWFGMTQETTWQPGSPWMMKASDGRVFDTGEVLEFEPPKRIVLKWRHQFHAEAREEGASRCVMELQPEGDAVKLTVTHTIERENSALIKAVSGGWPKVLSGLKSLLETGKALERADMSKA
jgi:uncharacterized protein YndB with AHSA1/START domain